jgi:hypothetical protein
MTFGSKIAQQHPAPSHTHRPAAVTHPRQITIIPVKINGRCIAVITLKITVIPAKAGIHLSTVPYADRWIPAFAGMTFGSKIAQKHSLAALILAIT